MTTMKRDARRSNDRGSEMKMRNRLAVATVALLVALPATAVADEVDCYADPTDPECAETPETAVLDDAEEAIDDDAEVEPVSAEELDVSADADLAALAETGISATMYTALAALLLAAGGLLLLASRRRKPTA